LQRAEGTAATKKTDYRIMEGVGHCLMLEKPAQFNAVLADMLHKFDLIEK